MSIITTYAVIDEDVISPWLLNIKSDIKVGSDDSSIQQCDITLANPGGKWDGAWNDQSILAIVLLSWDYIDATSYTLYSKLIFTGRCQKIDYGYTEVKIHAGCDLKQTASKILYDIHEHYGPTTDPIIKAVMQQFGIREGDIQQINLKKREWFYLGNIDARTVLDDAVLHDGYETYVDESNRLNHLAPAAQKEHPVLTGRMKLPQSSQSAVEFCDIVCVRGGSYLKATKPGAEQHTQYVIGEAKADASVLEKYGEIRSEFMYPELTTPEECQARAENLLKLYVAHKDVALPAVIGRSPEVNDLVTWQTRRITENGPMGTALMQGRVSRRRDEVSARSGWVTYMEVQPGLGLKNTDDTTEENENPEKETTQPTYDSQANTAIYTGNDGNYYRTSNGTDWFVYNSETGNWDSVTSPPAEVLNNYNIVRTTNTNPNPGMVQFSTS